MRISALRSASLQLISSRGHPQDRDLYAGNRHFRVAVSRPSRDAAQQDRVGQCRSDERGHGEPGFSRRERVSTADRNRVLQVGCQVWIAWPVSLCLPIQCDGSPSLSGSHPRIARVVEDGSGDECVAANLLVLTSDTGKVGGRRRLTESLLDVRRSSQMFDEKLQKYFLH